MAVQNEQPARSGNRPGSDDCVKPQDLRIGTILTVYGRTFLIHDCDAFTQKWLQVLHFHVNMPLLSSVSLQLLAIKLYTSKSKYHACWRAHRLF